MFFENSYRQNQPPFNIIFYAKMYRNVQTTLGMSVVSGLALRKKLSKFRKMGQGKFENLDSTAISQKTFTFNTSGIQHVATTLLK